MSIDQRKTSKFRSLNKWMNSGVLLGVILSSLFFILSIAIVSICSYCINKLISSDSMLAIAMFSIVTVVFLLLAIGALVNIIFTTLYIFDKQKNTLFIAILNLIFAFGLPGYLILYGENLDKQIHKD